MAEEKKQQVAEAVKDGQPKKTKPAGQVITGLKKEIAELKKELEIVKVENSKLMEHVDALKKRVHEKELIINRTEEEGEAKVANKDLIIRGMRTTMESVNKENARLHAEVQNLNDIIIELRENGERKGFFARIFGK